MKNQIAKFSCLLGSIFLLVGCLENRRDTTQLCMDHPELQCQKLNIDDGQCRITRTDLIWHRFDVLKDPTDINKITEFKLTQDYRICLETAAGIQPINQNELKQRRFNALVNAGNDLERLAKELHEYHTPESLYFLWSQTNDKKARREFLQMEHSPELQTARLQYALATFYIDRDPHKTLTLLNRALELTDDPDELIPEVIQSLASVNQFIKHKQNSYIWAMVAKEFDIPIVGKKWLDLLYGFDDAEKEKLDDVAEQVIESIERGKYQRTVIPDYYQ